MSHGGFRVERRFLGNCIIPGSLCCIVGSSYSIDGRVNAADGIGLSGDFGKIIGSHFLG